jgi:hypothetical protein
MKRRLIISLSLLASTAAADIPRLPKGVTDKVFPTRNLKAPPIVNLGVARHWDFDDGTLQGFTAEDATGGTSPTGAFANQPTFGDNVSAKRALDTASLQLPPNPCAGLALDELTTCEYGKGIVYTYLNRLRYDLSRMRSDLDAIGGGYWDTPFPIGKQGLYWIRSA